MTTSKHIDACIETMSLEMKIGQLFLLAYPGKEPRKIRPLMERYGISGCYISQDNAETFEEASAVCAALQAMAQETPHGLPMILGVDQEGAWGVLVPESLPGPGNMALGANVDKEIISQMYRVIGEEMLSVGYNTLLAPSADVNVDPRSPIIGIRSFGGNPNRVAECVSHAIRGARPTGILTTVKHFPGHGSVGEDTHREIPEVDKDIDELLNSDLVPFASGIDAGVDIVMTSHIRYPRIDPDHPATLSKEILQRLLRGRLGFEGVVVSDSMNMGAIRRFYDPAESTLMALKAGVDIVMLSEEHYDHGEDYFSKQMASLERVHRAAVDGELSIAEIDAKLRRIITLKQGRLKIKDANSPQLSQTEKEQVVRRAASGALCLIRNDHDNWPVRLDRKIICVNATPRHAYSVLMNPRGIGPNQALPAFDTFKKTLEASIDTITFLELNDAEEQPTILKNAEIILIVTEDAPLPGEDLPKEEQQHFVRHCLKTHRQKCVIIGLRSPYELLEYSGDITYLCAYSNRTCSAYAAAQSILSGKTPAGVNHIVL